MKYGFFILALVAAPAFAANGMGDFFGWAVGWGEDLYNTITEGVPGMMHRMMAYAIEIWVVINLKLQLEAIEFSWLVAREIIADLRFSETLNTLLGNLSPNTRAMIGILNIDFALEALLTARITRFVMELF